MCRVGSLMMAMRCKCIVAAGWVVLAAESLSADTLVQFRTTLGDIIVQLYDDDKPVTVNNFIRYVDNSLYTNMFFHRCVPGFVAQGGGFVVLDAASTNGVASVYYVPTYSPITNEFGVGPTYSNVYGTIAMAKVGGDPDSATSQWFFNLADNSANLDNQNGGFTVFGHVIKGSNVLESFNSRGPYDGLYPLNNTTFTNTPVTYSGTNWPQYNELIYANIELLRADLSVSSSGMCTISWNSVDGMSNVVEYASPSAPGSWQFLAGTNGNGSILTVSDPAADGRFYRVRVE